MKQPSVSILVLTWNHEEYIEQAVCSLLQQEYAGEIEILIGEDASDDQTLEICERLVRQNPGKIRLLSNNKNLGMHRNFENLWNAAKGEYIGFCEGDDYWIDPKKISKQIAFFDAQPDCTLCGTLTTVVEKNKKGLWVEKRTIAPSKIKKIYDFEDLIKEYHFHFSSILVKKSSVVFPDWFQKVYCVDRPLYLLAAENGCAGLIPETTSVYRLHSGGNWSAINNDKKAEGSIVLFQYMSNYFHSQYQVVFHHTLGRILWSYMAEDLSHGNHVLARSLFWKSLYHSGMTGIERHIGEVIKTFIRLYFPWIYVLKKERGIA